MTAFRLATFNLLYKMFPLSLLVEGFLESSEDDGVCSGLLA